MYVIFSKEAKLAGILIMINSNIQTGKQTSPTHSSVCSERLVNIKEQRWSPKLWKVALEGCKKVVIVVI